MKPAPVRAVALVITVMCSFNFVAAQGNSSTVSETENPSVILTLKAIAWDQSVPGKLLVREGDEFKEITLNTRKPSDPFRYQGEPIVRFYRPPVSEAEDALPIPWGAIQTEGKDSDLMLVFSPFPAKVEKLYRIFAFADESSTFGAGDYRFINLSDKDLIGMLGESRFALRPQGSTTVQPDWSEADNAIPLKIALSRNDNWVPGLRTMWSFRPGFRNIVFLLDSDNQARGFLKIKVISEPVRFDQ